MPDPTKIPQEKTAKIPIKEHFQLKETIVTIAADNQAHIEAAKEAIRVHRAALEMLYSFGSLFSAHPRTL